ncbi:CLUMA_CG004767, isoform A, partial [Clunio marinus]
IVACSSLISIIVPKAYFFCDTISHISFVIISYQFYRLCINYVEGESRFIVLSKEETFSLRAPPCCCCFGCLKKSRVTKQKFKILRFLVIQMAVVHVIIFLTLNLISIENPEVANSLTPFFVPFIAITIILGVWAFQITIRMVIPYFTNLNLLKKFITFQLVLVFCKLQPILLDVILKHFIISCEGPFTIIQSHKLSFK